MKKIKKGSVYRYCDRAKRVDFRITIADVKDGFVHAITTDGKRIKAEIEKVKDKLFDSDGYNLLGFDMEGYDERGYNMAGYNRNGVNKEGYDRSGNKVASIAAYKASCHAGTRTTSQKNRS